MNRETLGGILIIVCIFAIIGGFFTWIRYDMRSGLNGAWGELYDEIGEHGMTAQDNLRVIKSFIENYADDAPKLDGAGARKICNSVYGYSPDNAEAVVEVRNLLQPFIGHAFEEE